MGVRFRKSFKLAPGMRMNVGLGGVSWNVGPRGASIGVGKRGVHLNAGIPGTGLSARTRIAGGGAHRNNVASASKVSNLNVSIEVDDTGEITFRGTNGESVNDFIVAELKKQKRDEIMKLIQDKCDEINGQVHALGEIHHYASAPCDVLQYVAIPFHESEPICPVKRKPNFFQSLFKGIREKISRDNDRNKAIYEAELKEWENRKNEHQLNESMRKDLIGRVNCGELISMEKWLERVLNEIEWPRETAVSFEFSDHGKRLEMDVDLPEIEDMPNRIASVPQRGLRLSVKEMSSLAIQKLYMKHVHAVGFRIVGEAFSALPTLQEILLSGYSQRINRTTGHMGDEYLYSVHIMRSDWAKLNFARLNELDVVETFTQFTLKRSMTKSGVFKAIDPLKF